MHHESEYIHVPLLADLAYPTVWQKSSAKSHMDISGNKLLHVRQCVAGLMFFFYHLVLILRRAPFDISLWLMAFLKKDDLT